MGWAARAAAHKCVYNDSIFSLQISILIICKSYQSQLVKASTNNRPAPCFTSAGIYYILSQLIEHWRQRGYNNYSPIGPKAYLYTFISFDLLSIIIQGIGGGMASSASTNNKDTAPGTHTMIAGIIIQLVSMSVFCCLWLWTIFRARVQLRSNGNASAVGAAGSDDLTGTRLKVLILATCFSAACIVIRNFYRAVELAQGWEGYLITHEIYFCLLDGMLMAFSLLAFNLVHPAWYLRPSRQRSGRDLEEKRPSNSSIEPIEPMMPTK